jgi:hypothetical protein
MELKRLILILGLFMVLFSNVYSATDEQPITPVENTCEGRLAICNQDIDSYDDEISKLEDERDYNEELYLNSTNNITNRELIKIYNLYDQTINNYNQSIQEINQNIQNIEFKFYITIFIVVLLEFAFLGFNWKIKNDIKADVDFRVHHELKEFKTTIINIMKDEKKESTKKNRK